MQSPSIVLVGNPGIEHVGNHFRNAANALSLPVRFCNSEIAYRAHPVVAKLNWWLRSHRPTRLRVFSEVVAEECKSSRADLLLTTGLSPVDADALLAIGRSGAIRINFLTDDPWNSNHRAASFMQALPLYDFVFTPRRANINDLVSAGCRAVHYLPFAYAPEIHYPEVLASGEEELYSSDVFFAGGADDERVAWLSELIADGMRVALYGGYWNRYAATRSHDRGMASPGVLRKALAGARVALCLVRRANRDGHAMRTFELAAGGACLLAEDTEEHRQILGQEGLCAIYFRSIPEMLQKARDLLRDDHQRTGLSQAARLRICAGANTYGDRLQRMLQLAGIFQNA